MWQINVYFKLFTLYIIKMSKGPKNKGFDLESIDIQPFLGK